MKPYHEELSSKAWSIWQHHTPQNIFFWKLYVIIRPSPCWKQDSLLLASPGLYSQIYHRTPCPVVLICKEVYKKQKRGRIISSFLKGKTFNILWQPRALGDNLTMWPPFLHPPKKVFLSPSLRLRREHTWTLNWKESLLICFKNCLGVPYLHRQSRNRMINTLSYLVLPLHVMDCL